MISWVNNPKDWVIEDKENHRVRVGYMQWRSALKILCDHRKSMIHKDWEIVDNVNYRIRVGYMHGEKH